MSDRWWVPMLFAFTGGACGGFMRDLYRWWQMRRLKRRFIAAYAQRNHISKVIQL